MKYRSSKWWIYALYHQIGHLCRNIICRKLLHINFKKTGPDLLNEYINLNSKYLYALLLKKYPEFTWVEKYINLSLGSMIIPISNLALYKISKLPMIWFNDGTIDDLKYFIDLKIMIMTCIYIKDNIRHSVNVFEYDVNTNEVIFHDPLGDYYSNYKLVFGEYVRMDINYFAKINVGNDILISTGIPRQLLKEVKKHIYNKEYYIFE